MPSSLSRPHPVNPAGIQSAAFRDMVLDGGGKFLVPPELNAADNAENEQDAKKDSP
jgi:hypothetical protein